MFIVICQAAKVPVEEYALIQGKEGSKCAVCPGNYLLQYAFKNCSF